jgi:hypothetical protein
MRHAAILERFAFQDSAGPSLRHVRDAIPHSRSDKLCSAALARTLCATLLVFASTPRSPLLSMARRLVHMDNARSLAMRSTRVRVERTPGVTAPADSMPPLIRPESTMHAHAHSITRSTAQRAPFQATWGHRAVDWLAVGRRTRLSLGGCVLVTIIEYWPTHSPARRRL